MKMMMIAVAVLVLLGGGGAGAYFYFSQSAEASAGVGSDEAAKAAEAAKEAAEQGDGHGAGHAFVEMDPLILPIIDESGVSQVISLVVAIEVGNEADAQKVEALTPRLKDAFIQDMYGVLSQKASMKAGVIQVADLKARLNSISQRVLGEGIVKDVLLQVVQQRPV